MTVREVRTEFPYITYFQLPANEPAHITEKRRAVIAALMSLYDMYPPCAPIERSLWWRNDALRLAATVHAASIISTPFYHVRLTGIPNDVLGALVGLLDE